MRPRFVCGISRWHIQVHLRYCTVQGGTANRAAVDVAGLEYSTPTLRRVRIAGSRSCSERVGWRGRRASLMIDSSILCERLFGAISAAVLYCDAHLPTCYTTHVQHVTLLVRKQAHISLICAGRRRETTLLRLLCLIAASVYATQVGFVGAQGSVHHAHTGRIFSVTGVGMWGKVRSPSSTVWTWHWGGGGRAALLTLGRASLSRDETRNRRRRRPAMCAR